MTVEFEYAPLVLETSYLDDYRNAIRSKTIPWEGFARSNLIKESDAKLLVELEKHSANHKNANSRDLINSQGNFHDYITTILTILESNLPIERNDIKKNILVSLSDLLSIEQFTKELIGNEEVVERYLKVLNFNNDKDEILKLLSIYNSVAILFQVPQFNSQIQDSFLSNLKSLIEIFDSDNFNLKFLSINLIVELLTNKTNTKQYRSLIWSKVDTFLPILFKNLNETVHFPKNGKTTELIQFQYKVLLIIWILTFSTDKIHIIGKNHLDDLLSLIKILKISIKEKIIRLIVSIFINLSKDNSSSLEIFKFLILNGDLISNLSNLKERKWSDDELITDLDVLNSLTLEIFNKLTSFDEYLQELNLKTFKNSPVHTKDEFFIDNLNKFQDSNYKIFKELLNLLNNEEFLINSSSLKIYLLDIEKILKLDSKSKEILIDQGYKTKIMELLNHKNSEVRYEALKITQLLVSQSLK